MRRIENGRAAPFCRLENFEGRIELVFRRLHSGAGLRRALHGVLASDFLYSIQPAEPAATRDWARGSRDIYPPECLWMAEGPRGWA
jgi:hypothetical protein